MLLGPPWGSRPGPVSQCPATVHGARTTKGDRERVCVCVTGLGPLPPLLSIQQGWPGPPSPTPRTRPHAQRRILRAPRRYMYRPECPPEQLEESSAAEETRTFCLRFSPSLGPRVSSRLCLIPAPPPPPRFLLLFVTAPFERYVPLSGCNPVALGRGVRLVSQRSRLHLCCAHLTPPPGGGT